MSPGRLGGLKPRTVRRLKAQDGGRLTAQHGGRLTAQHGGRCDGIPRVGRWGDGIPRVGRVWFMLKTVVIYAQNCHIYAQNPQ